LKDGGKWELAPAYDVTHAHSPDSIWTAQHLMSVNGKFDDISRSDLLSVSDRFLIPSAKGILNEVLSAVGEWPKYASEAGVSPARLDAIRKDCRPV
jgi:serine/threonine-protein kinase HipA